MIKLSIIVGALAALSDAATPFCTRSGEIYWRQFRGSAQKIATNAKTNAVWTISKEKHWGGYFLASLDIKKGSLTLDKSAPSGAKAWMGNSLAVDANGQPAYVSNEKKLYRRKKEGEWMQPLPDPACAFSIAFDGKGSFYVRDCYFSYIHQLQKSGKWFLHTKKKELDIMGVYKGNRRALRLVRRIPKVLDFAADSRGNLWGIRMNGKVIRYNRRANKWYNAGLDRGVSITAGPKGHIYVLRDSPGDGQAIYSWNKKKWVAQAGKQAKSLAVGKRGRLWMVDSQDRIWFSPPNPRRTVCPRKEKKIVSKEAQAEELKKEFTKLLTKCRKDETCTKLAYQIFDVEEKFGSQDQCLTEKVSFIQELDLCKASQEAQEKMLASCVQFEDDPN